MGTSKIGNKIIYRRNGRLYTKLNRNEIIKEGAMQSFCNGGLHPITNADGQTIGHTPSEFSDKRDFYNLLFGRNDEIIRAMIEEAKMLKSECNENKEYDRALCELIGSFIPDSSLEIASKEVEKELNIISHKSLDDLLEEWSVIDPFQWENGEGPVDWYAVANNDGIIAYFGKEEDAYRFRLSEINRELNG